MSTIKIKIYVNELSNVMTQFDQIKVYRSDTETGVYAEISGVGTRPELVVDTYDYEFIDSTAPDSTYWYKTTYFNSSTLDESDFSDPIQGIDAGLYVSVQDIRDEDVDSDELDDDRALFLSMGWQDWFEHKTGLFFIPKSLELLLDGNGSRVLWLDIPIIEVDALYINDDFTTTLDEDDYVVYNRTFPDDRKNPRIKLKKNTSTSLFSGVRGVKFRAGDQNQKVVGKFGYVEDNYETPFLVRRAIMSLILMTAEYMSDTDIDQLSDGRRVEEVTDRHRVRFANLWDDLQLYKSTGITIVDQALAMYKRPIRVGMPRRFV